MTYSTLTGDPWVLVACKDDENFFRTDSRLLEAVRSSIFSTNMQTPVLKVEGGILSLFSVGIRLLSESLSDASANDADELRMRERSVILEMEVLLMAISDGLFKKTNFKRRFSVSFSTSFKVYAL
jgi:hypothetical protein